MSEAIARRPYLLAAIQSEGRPVSTAQAVKLLAGSPWPTAGRNTVRKDLRAMAAHGQLIPCASKGRRLYAPGAAGRSASLMQTGGAA
jgi:hypothetical protein